jgi:outer membrane protein TolC
MADNYLVGISLTWNVTGVYTSHIQKKRLEQKVQATQYGYTLEALQLKTQLKSSSVLIEEQVNQSEKSLIAVNKALEAYDLYLSRYQNGLIDLTALLQIQSLLQQAEKNNIDAHGQLWDQLVNKAALTGDFSYLSNQF